MRRLLRLAILLALLWAAGWFVTARVVERAAETWFAEQARDGWIAGYDALATGGFPGRVALDLEGVRMIDPVPATGWEADALRVWAQALRPRSVQARVPGPQRLWVAGTPLDLDGGLSATLRPGWAGGTPAAELAGSGLLLTGPAWQVALEILEIAGVRTEDGGAFSLAVDAVTLDPRWVPEGAPGQVDSIRLAGRGEFAEDASGAAAPERLVVEEAEIDWGATRLEAEGAVALDAEGRPEGRITFRAENWTPLLDLAVAAGLVRAEVAPTWARVFETLEDASGESGQLDLPLVFQQGRMSFGPIPLGPAPRLGG